MDFIRALNKRIFSYLKSIWDFGDYPIKTWKITNARDVENAFGAGIINWSLMVGRGETPEKAIQDLQERFNLYRESNTRLPRPGSYVPIQFASTTEIYKHEEIAVDFFRKVLNLDFYQGFFSDGTMLSDFEDKNGIQAGNSKQEFIQRTLAVYCFDITDIYSEPLYKIFEKIKNNRQE